MIHCLQVGEPGNPVVKFILSQRPNNQGRQRYPSLSPKTQEQGALMFLDLGIEEDGCPSSNRVN